ncbi:CBS domain-containing protein [Pseudonocardia acaciae]|uniref:CBS domain-containing protein n=1 Tax=Pseudonocardia acaciae TaxID=551276 RepID=UPI00048A6C0C|nr:CBS domain-containing protein [Pseudonocardia acaciae]
MSTEHARLAAPPETLDEDPPLADLMTRRLVGITPDADALVALGLLADAGIRHLPVLRGHRCQGLIFEHDIIRCLAEGRLRGPVTVGSLCRPVPTLRSADRSSTAARSMNATGVDAVLVTEGHRLVGLVTATDLIRSLAPAVRRRSEPER